MDKSGGDVTITAFNGPPGPAAPFQVWRAAAQGGAVAYAARSAFAGNPSNLPLNPYLGERIHGQWQTRGIGSPMKASNQNSTNLLGYNHLVYAPDLDHGVLTHLAPNGPILADGGVLGYPNLYVRELHSNSAKAVTTVTPPNFAPQLVLAQYVPQYQGASADYSHVIFTAPDQLTPDAPQSCFSTASNGDGCLYESTPAGLRLVSILPDGTPAAMASAGGNGGIGARNLENAVSEDGSKIYWTEGSQSGAGAIYVRVNGTETISVGTGRFRSATPDGSHAIYENAGNIMVFSLATGTSTAINSGGSAELVGASDDLSYIYYIKDGELYLNHDGVARFIAAPVGASGQGQTASSPSPLQRSSYVAPNGKSLLFTSNAPLTGYDNSPATPEACEFNNGSVPCPEVFHYEAESGQLVCASCNPSGGLPRGPSSIQTHYDGLTQPRVGSDDGTRAFFNSSDRLVPHDTNGQQDVYEWRRNGTAGCENVDGCISLISGGTDGAADPDALRPVLTYFVDASADGADVFFTTQDRLVPSDVAGDADLYDARVNGGIAAQHEVAPSPCSGDECQGTPIPTPDSVEPGTSQYSGAGNKSEGAKARNRSQRCRRAQERAERLVKRSARMRRTGRPKRARKLRRKARDVKRVKCRHSRAIRSAK